MRVAIYAPISLWEMHQAQMVDIVWREHNSGAQVTILSCRRGLAFCAANPNNEVLKCYECIYRTKYLVSHFLPNNTRHLWLIQKSLSKETEARIQNVKSHKELNEFSFEGWQVGKTVMSELVSLTRSIYISDEAVKATAHKNLKYSIGMYLQAKEMINREFDRVYVWGGRRSSEDCVAAAARACSIPIVYFEVGSSVDKYLISSNEPHSFDGIRKEILEFTDRTKGEKCHTIRSSAERYFESLRLGNAHTPHFKNFLAGYDDEAPTVIKNSSKPVLTIFTSSAWEFAFFKDSDKVPKEFLDVYTLYLRIALDKEILSRYQVVFRWHPNLINAGMLELEKVAEVAELSKNTCIHIKPGDRFNSYKLLKESSVVVTTGSTIGIEAAFYGKPTILLGKALYGGLGSVYEPSSYSEFKKLLFTQPKALANEGAQLWAYWTSNYGVEFKYVYRKDTNYFFGGQRVRKISFILLILQKMNKLRRRLFLDVSDKITKKSFQ